MRSVTYAYLGTPEAAGRLAKKGTASDVVLYNAKQDDSHLNLVAPARHPEKVQGLAVALDLADRIVLHPSAVDRALGETIVGAELFGKSQGILRCEDPVLGQTVKGLLGATGLGGLVLDAGPEGAFRERLYETAGVGPAGPVLAPSDHAFPVKGIGTVVLALVRRGAVRRHADLQVYPTEQTVSVRSIQVHDVDHEEAPAGSRVGLALKGIEADEVRRGRILAEPGSLGVIPAGEPMTWDVTPTRHNKWVPRSGAAVHVFHVLQDVVLRVDSADAQAGRIRIQGRLDAPVVRVPEEPCVLLDLDNASQRFIGRAALPAV